MRPIAGRFPSAARLIPRQRRSRCQSDRRHAVTAVVVGMALLASLEPRRSAAADPAPDPAEVVAAMKKATAYYSDTLAVHGGYASSWKRDGKRDGFVGETEHSRSRTVISIQPPGTTTVGLALVKAYAATGDRQFLEAAAAAAGALVECQLASGGWHSDFDFAEDQAKRFWLHRQVLSGDTVQGKRRNASTLDDDKTQSALLFLTELAHVPESSGDKPLQEAVRFGLDSLVAAQFPNGGWPQQYNGPADPKASVKPASYPDTWPRTWPDVNYHGFYTLNDGNLDRVAAVMLRAHELTKNAAYLASAKKLGDFLILAQMPDPQRAWAQQYDGDMHPVWARKFEPPSVTGGESIGAMETLHNLYVVTGDAKYLAPLADALAWYERSALPDGSYARFYELKTNKPLYFVKDTYELTYDDANLPTHYGFKLDHVARHLASLRQRLQEPREKLLADRAEPTTEKSWTSRAKGAIGKVWDALKTRNADGVWVKGDRIDAGEFTKHVTVMARYVEAARKGGREFKKLRDAGK